MLSFYLYILLPTSLFFFFFFNDTATTEIYTLSLHDALPIFYFLRSLKRRADIRVKLELDPSEELWVDSVWELWRSEEHTSELQSQSNLVCRLLLEKKKQKHRCIILDCYSDNTLYTDRVTWRR